MRAPRLTFRPSLRAGKGRRTTAQVAALALAAGTVVVLAARYEGAAIHRVDLNDGGVWVTNGTIGMMARLNSQSEELELGVLTSSTSRAVFQEAASVAVYDDGGGNPERSVTRVDVVSGTGEPVSIPASFEASAGRDTVAILDDATGRVWIKRSDQLEGFADNTPQTTKVAPRSAVVVTRTGTALIADRQSGRVTAWRLDSAGLPVKEGTTELGDELTDGATLSAVGEQPVVLQEGQLLRPGTDPLPVGQDAVLQQPGPATDTVLLATDRGLFRAGLTGGDADQISTIDVDGPASAPVLVAGCAHVAWKDPGRPNYLRLCQGKEPFAGEIKPLDSSAELVFRVNRDVVVLNDVVNGPSWMVQVDGLTLVNNWDSVNPEAADPQVARADQDRKSKRRNQPPRAVDDKIFGARPGATVVLPVTLNDVDPDGDIITLTKPPASTRQATFSVVGDGTQVQAKILPNASGTVEFEYEVTDGRDQHTPSKATVTLGIYPEGVDKAPKRLPQQDNKLKVAVGHQASVNVLPAWYDPEGDPLVLESATSQGGDIGIRPDGTIDFTDDGKGPGAKKIDFVLKGGEATQTGSVAVTVVEEKKATPVAIADHFTGLVGGTVLLDPLRNDTDPLGGQLSLPSLRVVDGGQAQVGRDSSRGTATFRSDRYGTYYLEYVAANSRGQVSEPTLVRVDIRPRTGANNQPVATRDTAAVRAGGSVLVDVLANDSDPDGDVMVVQGVEVPPSYAGIIKASLINKRFVRVEASRPFDGKQPTFDYVLSDGRSDPVRGAVSVTESAETVNRRPTALDDLVTARAGTIITVPVLDNDADPDGDRLTVYTQDLFDVGGRTVIEDGKIPVVATGTGIRVLVPDDGTTQLQIGYGTRDQDQARADARLVLNIKPDKAADNQPPQPRPIEDRTVTGQRIRVDIDQFGADPDGDPLVYAGLVEPPKYGRVVQSGTSWFEYEPFEGDRNTGTDAFKILLADPYGATGIADVRIGVAPRSPENQDPAALDDHVVVKPGLTLQYPVLDNDSDPDGDPLAMVRDAFAHQGVTAKLVGTAVQVVVPDATEGAVDLVTAYTISDGLGGTSSAQLTVTASDDAPDHAPIAQDDVASAEEMRGKEAGDSVLVDVLANDGDLDGARSDLELTTVGSKNVEVTGRKVRIRLAKASQVVPYRIIDRTGQSSFAFVYVAGTDSMPPQLDADAVPVDVVAGEAEELDLTELVVVRPGRTPKLSRNDRITASNGTATGSGSTMTFRAPKAYHGPASVTAIVIDGADNNDPSGLSAQITIPVNVLPATNVPPTVRSTRVVVRAGADPVSIDLERLATDPNEDDELSFDVSGAERGVTADVEGTTLLVSAASDARSAEVPLDLEVTDGKSKAVHGRIRVVVVGAEDAAGLAPPMVLRDLRFPDAEKGEELRIDLTDAIVSDPFPEEDKDVVRVESTGPVGEPSVRGTTLVVTPKDDGEAVITYSLGDGSGDPERAVDGRIEITVATVPDAPGKPTAVEGGPDSVQLTWREPHDGGRPIDHYVVYRDGGSPEECPNTQCLIAGLDPGSTYRFQVLAVNDVGEGDLSPKSDPVTPDTVPGTMAAPTVSQDFTQRNGKLILNWVAPENSGSDILRYELRSYPATTVKKAGPADTSLTWEGLTNGTDYRFTILAVNDRGPGVESAQSTAEKPFTLPSTMPAPTLQAEAPNGDGKGYLTVTWSRLVSPDDGWDEVSAYHVELLRDGSPVTTKEVAGASDMTTFDVENGHAYSARIWATNRAGSGEASTASASDLAWDKASAPTSISKSSDCPDNRCQASTSAYYGKVSFTTPADNGGYPVEAYSYQTSDGRTGRLESLSTTATGAPATGIVRFASAQQNQSVTLTPITTVPGEGEQAGKPGSGGGFNPFAKPKTPTGSGSGGYRSVNLAWNGGDGNGRAVDATQIRGDASGDFNGGGSRDIATSQGGEQRCIQVRNHTAGGGWSDWSGNICGTAQARTVEVYFTYTPPRAPCNANCEDINIRLSGFRSNTNYPYSTNIVSSVDGSVVSGNVGTNGDGRAEKRVAVYNTVVYDEETYCVTVDGVQGCKKGN